MQVTSVIVHPSYRGQPRKYADDIAFLLLESPVHIDEHTMPICIDKVLLQQGDPVYVSSKLAVRGSGSSRLF